jgi:hypothetical protein
MDMMVGVLTCRYGANQRFNLHILMQTLTTLLLVWAFKFNQATDPQSGKAASVDINDYHEVSSLLILPTHYVRLTPKNRVSLADQIHSNAQSLPGAQNGSDKSMKLSEVFECYDH